MADTTREFSLNELQTYNGQDGRPVYVAHEGRVYDVSESKMWKTGTHMKQHSSGNDLSGEIENAPHEPDVLDRFPQVGVIALGASHDSEPDYAHLPRFLGRILNWFPFLERHPHPMTVHFPIVFNLAAPVFLIAYLITGVQALEITAFYVLGAAVLFSLVAIPTGYLTWWINYHARPIRPVVWKIVLTAVLFLVGAVAFVLRWRDPAIIESVRGTGLLYLILICSLFPIISVIGWFGATLTFPLHKRHKTSSAATEPLGSPERERS